jgi:hypothetical protein
MDTALDRVVDFMERQVAFDRHPGIRADPPSEQGGMV